MAKSTFFPALFVVIACAACSRNSSVVESGETAGGVSFSEVTTELGLGDFQHATGAHGEKWFPETMGSGVAFADIDGDSWQDIIVVGGGDLTSPESVRKLWIYTNNEGTGFQLNESMLDSKSLPGYGFGIAAADYDNDGDADLFLSNLGYNNLLRNDGDVFTEVGEAAGVAGDAEDWSTSSIFFDANNDGWLDLYVGNYVEWTDSTDLFCSLDGIEKAYCTPQLYEGTPGRFYLNNQNGSFTDATIESGFPTDGGKNLGVSALDFNRDGWTDLMIANDTDPDQLLENVGEGSFREIGLTAGVAFDERGRARAGMGIDTGVVDATGEETIFVGNFSNQMIGVYRHVSNSAFIDRAATSQIGRSSLLTLTFGLFLFDADLDSDLDLFAVNGHVQPSIEAIKDNVSYRQPSHLFLNDGNGIFSDIGGRDGVVLQDSLVGRGAAYADYDHDGDLDIVVTENGGGVRLFRNDLETRNYVRVRLEGRVANRDAIGARVLLHHGDTHQSRYVRTGSSFLSQSELDITFGIPKSTAIDSLVVIWPGGHRSSLVSVDANKQLVIVEDQP